MEPKKSSFKVSECIGVNQMISEHFHEQYEIYYLAGGEINYFVKDRTYSIKEGDVVIIPPNTLHKTIRKNDRIRKRIVVDLYEEFLEDFYDKGLTLWSECTILHIEKNGRINRIFYELLEEYNSEQNPLLLKALTCELVLFLHREKDRSEKYIESSPASKLVADVVTYLNSSFDRKVTLAETAKLFFTNTSYLSRIFKEHTGLSFSDYLIKLRIKKAVERLMGSDDNITKIAFDTGFSSTNHFCKVFKSVMNISPLQYKKAQFKSPEK